VAAVQGRGASFPGEPEFMRASLRAELHLRSRAPKRFESLEAATEWTRTAHLFPKTRLTAENITRRNFRAVGGGADDGREQSVETTLDMRTFSNGPTAVATLEPMIFRRQFCAAVACPLLHVLAADHYTKWQTLLGGDAKRLGAVLRTLRECERAFSSKVYRAVTIVTPEGQINSHHVHSDAPVRESFLRVHWVAVPKELRARRVNRHWWPPSSSRGWSRQPSSRDGARPPRQRWCLRSPRARVG
jgi:hypothetical protein